MYFSGNIFGTPTGDILNTGKSYFVPTKSNKKIAHGEKRQKRFLTTAKRGRTPLRFFIGEKFKENKPSKDLSPEAVKTIKNLHLRTQGMLRKIEIRCEK